MALETVVTENSSFIFTNRKYCGLSPSKQQIQGAYFTVEALNQLQSLQDHHSFLMEK